MSFLMPWRRSSRLRKSDRRSIDPELLAEYDAFGPWIREVRSAGDMPRRFRGHYEEHAGARFLLKIPANIERRAAQPGQDLYRAVLAVHDDRVSLLSLEGDRVVEASVGVGAIAAIRNDTRLLLGELSLHLSDGRTLTVTYNTISQPVIASVIDFLRSRITTSVPAPTTGEVVVPTKDYYFRNLIADEARRRGRTDVLYCEERGRKFHDSHGHRLRARGLLALDTGEELTLITRGGASYATGHTHLPHASILDHDVREEERSHYHPRQLRVSIPGHELFFDLCGEGGRLLPMLGTLGSARGHAPEPRPGGG